MSNPKRLLLVVIAILISATTAIGLYLYALKGTDDGRRSAGRTAREREIAQAKAAPGSPYVKESKAKNGNVIAEVYAEPVRFRDDDGVWQNIDTTLVPKASTLAPKAADSGLMFGEGYKTPLTLSAGRTRLSFTPAAGADVQARVNGDTATYKAVYPETSLERIALADGVKETFVLSGQGHPAVFETNVKTGLTLKKEPDGSIGYYDGPTLVAVSPVPDVIDGKGQRRLAVFSLGKGKISLALPKDMSGLEYPLRLDPTTYIVSEAADGYFGYDWEGGSGDGSDTAPYLEVSLNTEGGKTDSWLKFPLTGLSDPSMSGYPILSATMNIYYGNRIPGGEPMSIAVNHVPDYGVLDENDWYTPPIITGIDPAPVTESTPLGWHSVDVLPQMLDDLANYRSVSAFRLSMSGGAWYTAFDSSEALGNKPYLRVVFTADEATPRTQITDPADQTSVSGASYTITGTASPRQAGPAVTLVEVSTDGGVTWSPAVGTNSWSYSWTLPADGDHIIKTRATDGDGIVEAPGPGVRVLVDNGPPTASISLPLPNATVSGPMPIVGTATDASFDKYVIEYGKGAAPPAWVRYGDEHTAAVAGATLETINTLRLENYAYTFRLTVFDTTGRSSQTAVTVNVSNDPQAGSPHGNYQLDSDVCALCHGTHGAVFSPGLLKLGAVDYQSQLCYTCHNGTASIYNIQQEFDTNQSHHPIRDPAYASDESHTLLCSDCHDPHGSAEVAGRHYPRLLRAADAAGVKSYQGDSFCYSCHGQDGALKDMRYFGTGNAHSNTDPGQTTSFTDPGSGTKVKCDVCHTPHGSQQARLRLDKDAVICGSCHADTPYTLRTDNEVVVGIGFPDAPYIPPLYAGARVFAQSTYAPPPVGLKGPEEYRAPNLGFPPRLRGIAIGDATNHGVNDIVATIADGNRNALAVWPQADDGYSLGTPKLFDSYGGYGVAVGDVNLDGLQETVVTTLDAPHSIRVLTIMGDAIIGQSTYTTGGVTPRKVAIGDVTGDGLNDIVVANYGSNSVTVFRQSAGALVQNPPVNAGGTYTYGIAIGDVDGDGANEVIVANQGYLPYAESNGISPPYENDNITVFNSDTDGALTLSRTLSNGPETIGWDVAVGNVVDGAPGNEIVVAGHPMYISGRYVNGKVTVLNINDNSTRIYDSGALDTKGVAVADANGDGSDDVVTVNASSVSVLAHGAADLGAPAIYPMAGYNTVGMLDEPGPIAVGNIGKPHPYGHRIEVLGVCTACHDPHAVTKAAPIQGASGVEPVYGAVTTYAAVPNVLVDYQLCYKCHSGAAVPMIGERNVAEEMNPANTSYHAVMAPGRRADFPAGSFVAPWNQTSRLTCGDCHGKDAAATPQILHGSANADWLRRPYDGVATSDNRLLCYSCHSQAFYGPGYGLVGDYSWYRSDSGNSHRVHTNGGIACTNCHDVHGAAGRQGMIRPEMDMIGNPPGPYFCRTACHR